MLCVTFLSAAGKFCMQMGKYINKTSLSSIYYSCKAGAQILYRLYNPQPCPK